MVIRTSGSGEHVELSSIPERQGYHAKAVLRVPQAQTHTRTVPVGRGI